jgi:aminomethyltransferase
VLRVTPFHLPTAPLCQGQTWRRWAGHLVASSYELQHDREYHAIRSAAALFDVSPLYKYVITGPDAAALLDRVVTRDVARCRVGQVLYTPWCDSAGKQIDDGTVARLGEETFRLTAAEPNLRWLRRNATGLRVAIADASEATAAPSAGPVARSFPRHERVAASGTRRPHHDRGDKMHCAPATWATSCGSTPAAPWTCGTPSSRRAPPTG